MDQINAEDLKEIGEDGVAILLDKGSVSIFYETVLLWRQHRRKMFRPGTWPIHLCNTSATPKGNDYFHKISTQNEMYQHSVARPIMSSVDLLV